MIYLRAYAAGMMLPATVLPLIYTMLYLAGHTGVRSEPLQFLALFLPLAWGMWNIVYFAVGDRCPVKRRSRRLFAQGAVLGIIAASLGIFVFDLPRVIFHVEGSARFLILIILPIFYGVLWLVIVGPLNKVVGLQDWSE